LFERRRNPVRLVFDPVEIGQDRSGAKTRVVDPHAGAQVVAVSHHDRRCSVNDVNPEEPKDPCVGYLPQADRVIEQGEIVRAATRPHGGAQELMGAWPRLLFVQCGDQGTDQPRVAGEEIDDGQLRRFHDVVGVHIHVRPIALLHARR